MKGSTIETRKQRLDDILRGFGSVLIGYSGGVDSVFLARAAVDVLGADRVLAVTGRSDAYPEAQRKVAIDCARRFGIPHLEIPTAELEDPRYAANPSNRCYFCKTELWSKLVVLAAERGLDVVADGSNHDDLSDYRPGAAAAAERGVRSPLQEAGLSKAEIRELSRTLGLPTWDMPSAPCLSSRLPYGLAVTPERLRQVEKGEEALRRLGFREFRVRHHGNAARIETAPAEIGRAVMLAAQVARALHGAGFQRVLLDVEGYRRGALNEGLPLVQIAR
jgi:pyridinium-3,5-biscarboxylic acid mononucleotide sulfurtransferase